VTLDLVRSPPAREAKTEDARDADNARSHRRRTSVTAIGVPSKRAAASKMDERPLSLEGEILPWFRSEGNLDGGS
jgi:hypothetical protein